MIELHITCCPAALKIHISEECYHKLDYCATHSHGYMMTLRGNIEIKVIVLLHCAIMALNRSNNYITELCSWAKFSNINDINSRLKSLRRPGQRITSL